MPTDIKHLVASRLGENYELHARHVNPTLVNVQRVIGVDRVYANARGPWLFDLEGNRWLDFISGYSVFNIGRNHPAVKKAIRDTLDLDLPNMVQMDSSLLSGLLAEALCRIAPPHLDAVFFCNSGTESVEAAIKFARAATGKPTLLAFSGAFHGLSCGALSLNGNPPFREGFDPLLPHAEVLPAWDIPGLARRLERGDVAALFIEPVQGKGVRFPAGDEYRQAEALCRKRGALLVSDEVQTGLGRTGRWFGFEHWGLEPDIVTLAKSLSGGYVPCGAVLTRRAIHQKMFSRLDRCVVHSSTFGRNNLAMAAGLATIEVIREEKLLEKCRETSALLAGRLEDLRERHSLIREVRAKGLMIGIEFHEPRELGTRLGWKLLHRIEPELFAQMIVTTLFKRHRILTQVAGHGQDVLKILPPLVIGPEEVDLFIAALDDVLSRCRRFPGPIWDLGSGLVRHATQSA